MTSGMSFTVDMKAAKTFDELKLDAGGANDYPRGYQVFVSNDGASFGSAIANGTGAGISVTAKFPAQTARFIKVALTAAATSWWSISEFNLFTDGSSGSGGSGGSWRNGRWRRERLGWRRRWRQAVPAVQVAPPAAALAARAWQSTAQAPERLPTSRTRTSPVAP